MVKILITMDGGIIQEIRASDEQAEIYVVDYDIEGIETDHPHLTKFDGDECVLYKIEPLVHPSAVDLAEKTWSVS